MPIIIIIAETCSAESHWHTVCDIKSGSLTRLSCISIVSNTIRRCWCVTVNTGIKPNKVWCRNSCVESIFVGGAILFGHRIKLVRFSKHIVSIFLINRIFTRLFISFHSRCRLFVLVAFHICYFSLKLIIKLLNFFVIRLMITVFASIDITMNAVICKVSITHAKIYIISIFELCHWILIILNTYTQKFIGNWFFIYFIYRLCRINSVAYCEIINITVRSVRPIACTVLTVKNAPILGS